MRFPPHRFGRTRHFFLGWLGGAVLIFSAGASEGSGVRVGAGVQYWRTADSPGARGIERDGRSEFVSVQRTLAPLVKLQVDLERYPRNFAGSPRPVLSPQALVVIGGWAYGAAGIGALYSDGRMSERPYYQARAGLDWPILPRLRLDLHARYHVSEWGRINRIDRTFESNLWSFGAGVRLAL